MALPGYVPVVAGAASAASAMNGVIGQTEMYFLTTAARDAAITAPLAGMHCFIDGTYDLWQYYDGSAWVTYRARGSGTPEGNVTAGIGASYLRTNGAASTTLYVKESGTGTTGWVAYGAAPSNTPVEAHVAGAESISSTSPTGWATACAVTVVVPASGIVRVDNWARIGSNTGSLIYASVGVALSSGNTRAADANTYEFGNALINTSSDLAMIGRSYVLTGLTPGSTVFTQQGWGSTAAATVARTGGSLAVTPC